MRRGCTFKFARGLAVTSMLVAPGTSLVATTHGDAPTHHAEMQPSTDHELFLSSLWQLVWGLPFEAGASGMILSEELDADIWVIQVGGGDAENPIVTEGLFLEESRHDLPSLAWSQELLDEAGLLSADNYAVAGLLVGPTGFAAPIVALVRDVTAEWTEGLSPAVLNISLITPIKMTADVESAVAVATGLEGLPLPPAAIDDPNNETPDHRTRRCGAEYQLRMQSCFANHLARVAVCGAVAVACLLTCPVGCAALGPGYPACYGLCLAGCFVIESGCLAGSLFLLRSCRLDAMATVIACDPSWPDIIVR